MADHNFLTLYDEDGNELQYEFLDLEKYQENEYVVLLPADDTDGMVVILQVEETDDEDEESETFTSVEDQDVLEAVYSLFKDKFSDEFDFA